MKKTDDEIFAEVMVLLDDMKKELSDFIKSNQSKMIVRMKEIVGDDESAILRIMERPDFGISLQKAMTPNKVH